MADGSPYLDMVSGLPDDGFADHLFATRERSCREDVGYGTFAEASELYITASTCPKCGPWGTTCRPTWVSATCGITHALARGGATGPSHRWPIAKTGSRCVTRSGSTGRSSPTPT